MVGLDTNVLVRYFAQDDPVQSPAAERILDSFTQEMPGFVSQMTLVETVWVLSRSYKMTREAIAEVIETLLQVSELVVENTATSYQALASYRATKADFSDTLIAHAGLSAACQKTLTFDRVAANVPGMQRIG